ncbi:hypothetical protein, partial [Eggerthella guodeyinii]
MQTQGDTSPRATFESTVTAHQNAFMERWTFHPATLERQRRKRCRRKETVMAKIVSSWNDWDPLKRVIVGRCDYSMIPP